MLKNVWRLSFLVVLCLVFVEGAEKDHESMWETIKGYWSHLGEGIEENFREVEETPKVFMDTLRRMASENPETKKAFEHSLDPRNWLAWYKEHGHKEHVPSSQPYFPYDFEVDPKCYKFENYYYRTYDGSCNWLKKGQADLGVAGGSFGRDRPAHYAPGSFNKPREGPNVRELSNIFFKNKRTKYWEHSFWLPSWIEFLVHDLMLSSSGTEPGDVYNIPVPKCDEFFDPNCTGSASMPFWRSARVAGTGETGPRETRNDQTPWIDLSSIYGRNKEENHKMRSFVDGKIVLDEEGYLPLNFPRYNFTMIGGDPRNVFAAPDPRANQDWGLMSLHILFTREHNRLCDIMKEQHPEWNDEQIFQAARMILTVKMTMIGNAYFIAYFLDSMPFPKNPLNIYDQWHGTNLLPIMTWPFTPVLDPETGAPKPLPNEFSVGYRWHVLLPDHMPIVDERNNIKEWVSVPATAFNATGLKKVGIDSVFRGMAVNSIPDFHSGIQDGYRNMRFDFHDPKEGKSFDLAAWAIEHERERGLPTFNEYMKGYQGKVPIRPRTKFEDFTSDPVLVSELKRLYKTVDDVDLMVGQELDEDWWPHTHIPRANLIINFYTLFVASIQDRFVVQYNLFWCFLVGKPWNCTTNNILQDLFWKPAPKLGKNGKWIDTFWMDELGLANNGADLLHDVIIKNSNVKCLQKNVFFLADEKTNPIVCYGPNYLPGPSGKADFHFLFGGIFNIEPYTEYTKQYGDIMHYILTQGGDHVLVASAEYMAQIFFSGNYDVRANPDYFAYTYGRAGGHRDGTFEDAITNADFPAEWINHRKVMDEKIIPSYSSYVPEMNKLARKYITRLMTHVGERHYEPYYEAREYAFNLTGHFDFGDKLFEDPVKAKELFEASLVWLDVFGYFAPFSYPWPWIIYYWERKLNNALDTWSDWMDASLAEKRRTGNYGSDWLGLHAGTLVDGKHYYTDYVSKAIAFEILEANVGPFPTLVTYGMYLLGSNPDIQAKIYNEIRVLGDRDVTLADIHNMPILMNTVKEILRKYPAGGGINVRVSYRDTQMGGYEMPAKTNFVTSTLATQNDPRYWENPQQFNPDRWNNASLPIHGSWTVFGDGQRGCAGRQFALLAGSVSIAHIVRNFEIQYTASAPPQMGFTMFATFKTPVKVNLIPRPHTVPTGTAQHDEL